MKQDSEKNAGTQAYNPMDMVDEPIPCVYGPPEWYGRNGNLDDNHPSARRFKERIRDKGSEGQVPPPLLLLTPF